MTAREINQLLNDTIAIDNFKLSIADEFENYARLMKTKGSVIHLQFEEDEIIHLDKIKFNKLLDLVIEGRLSNIHLAYICDCLTMADDLVVDEKTKELIFEIGNPEINGGYKNNKELRELISRLD